MTDKQINHYIAEVCGWTQIHDSGIWHNFEPWGYPPEKPGQEGNAYNFLPKYCSDLNAMHEAEKILTSEQCLFVRDYLRERLENYPASRYIWHATARQRAEAFLRTLGKWDQYGDATEMEVQK